METTELRINPILKEKPLAWGLLSIALILSLIENFFKINIFLPQDTFLGTWNIIYYLMLLVPLVYMLWRKQIINPYTKYFIPFLLIMIGNMFYYNNSLTQNILPIIFYIFLYIAYTNSMHNIHHLHQVIFVTNYKISFGFYIKAFFNDLFIQQLDKKFYTRIIQAIAITVPFLIIFSVLLYSADHKYATFYESLFESIFTVNIPLEARSLLTVPLFLILYLVLFIFSFSNYKTYSKPKETKILDTLIVGIFLGLINLLFFSFLILQIEFLFTGYIDKSINIASFAREGFSQLMMVMGLVSLIFLFILRRHKNETFTTSLLIGLLVQTIIMGIVSLKKMYLYQSIMGATVLRYYVEWFDYFLLFILSLGIIFLLKRYAFAKMLDTVVLLAFISFTLISSLNVDAIVAKHNIEKFKDTPQQLDKVALSRLSIDALPIIKEYHIQIQENGRTKQKRKKMCQTFASYHYGYCSTLKKYEDIQ